MTTEEQLQKEAIEIADIETGKSPANNTDVTNDAVLKREAAEIEKIENATLAKTEAEKPAEKAEPIISEKTEGEGLATETIKTEAAPITEVKVEVTETEKPWYEQTKKEAAPKEVVNESVENNAKLLDYENKLRGYEEIMEDPLIRAILANKASGKGIDHLLEEIKPTDPKKLTEEQLIRYEAEANDMTDEDSIQVELDSLSTMSPLQKIKRLNLIRAEIEESNKARLKRYASETTTIVADKAKSTQIAIQELESSANALVDKDVFGLKITKEISDDIKETYLTKRNPVYKSDGTPDIEASIKLYLWEKQLPTLVKSNVIAAKFAGQKEVIKEITNPSLNTTTARVIDQINDLDELEAAEKEYKNQQGIN